MRSRIRHWARSRWCAVVILVIAIVNARLWMEPVNFPRSDDARYCALALSLAEHGTYQLITHPDSPTDRYTPPGYPFLLSLLIRTIGVRFDVFQWLSIGFAGAAALVWWMVLSRSAGGVLSTLTMLAVLTNAHWLLSASGLFTEPLYYLLTGIAVLMCDRLCSLEKSSRRSLMMAALLGIVLAATLLVRMPGACLAISIGLYLMFSRKWIELAVVVAVSSCLWLPWQIRNQASDISEIGFSDFAARDPYHPDAGTVAHFTDLIPLIERRSLEYYAATPYLLLGKLSMACRPIIALLMFSGLIAICRKPRARVPAGFLILTMLLNLGWPYFESGRFLYPVLPLLQLCFFRGLLLVANGIGRPLHVRTLAYRYGYFVVLALALMQLPNNLVHACNQVAQSRKPQKAEPYEAALLWIREQGRPGVILARKPGWAFWAAGRPSLSYPNSTDDKAFFDLIDRYHVRYIVQEPQNFSGEPMSKERSMLEIYLKPFVSRNAKMLTRVWDSDDGTCVWEIHRASREPQ